MDDSSCLRYFLEPDDTLHRRYEALRAYFVQRRPLPEIAIQFGYTYDTLRQVADSYFLFLYPFLISAPGYGVRATNLSDAERDRNLETLRFISRESMAHGIDFQLGIWTHGYTWAASVVRWGP